MVGKTTILFVTPVAELYGAEQSLLSQLEHLDRVRYEPVVLAPLREPLGNELRRLDVELLPAPETRLRRSLNPFRLLSGGCQVLSLARAVRTAIRLVLPHLIHANGIAAATAAIVSGATRGRPLIWHLRDESGPPALLRWLGRTADHVVAPSARTESWLRSMRCGELSLSVVPNGLRLPRAAEPESIREALALPENTILLGHVGQLIPRKRADLVIRAFATLERDFPDAHLLIAGDDAFAEHSDYVKHLKRLASPVADRVHFLGFVANMEAVLRDLTVLVQPAAPEPFGRAVLEAMACGCPAIVIEGTGSAELVEHGSSGYLIAPNDAASLATHLARVLSNPSLRQELSIAARQRAGRFSGCASTRAMERIYERLLSMAPKPVHSAG